MLTRNLSAIAVIVEHATGFIPGFIACSKAQVRINTLGKPIRLRRRRAGSLQIVHPATVGAIGVAVVLFGLWLTPVHLCIALSAGYFQTSLLKIISKLFLPTAGMAAAAILLALFLS
jgi:hypothetical protein